MPVKYPEPQKAEIVRRYNLINCQLKLIPIVRERNWAATCMRRRDIFSSKVMHQGRGAAKVRVWEENLPGCRLQWHDVRYSSGR